MNLAVLRRIASTVLLAGACAGVLLTGVQQLQVSKIILQAEVYEEAAAAKAHEQAHEQAHAAATAPGAPAQAHEHEHEGEEWEPANGFERTAYTVLANISMAIGFGLFLAAAIVISGRQVTWRSGLLWGVAGYLVFFVAPSLGLPPEVPGTMAAPLHARQLWWVMTAGMTAAGLGLGVYARHWALKLLGVVLLIVPHLIGAPHPAVHGSAAPEELAQAFIHATALANGLFWLTLGGLIGYFYKKFA
ncbi:CbtA family protein [Herbaspirillum rhizosphaerae]|uniref:CbtA family protein n=1 Tax=Herbaspirillum rhizosphaerae TaxID=346179 RepID=UPI00067B77D6|nr:CbtA family protein [Herbaspirillum rhizosphaerae]